MLAHVFSAFLSIPNSQIQQSFSILRFWRILAWIRWSLEPTQIKHDYPLVNVYITNWTNHHFSWINPLFQLGHGFNSYVSLFTRPGILYIFPISSIPRENPTTHRLSNSRVPLGPTGSHWVPLGCRPGRGGSHSRHHLDANQTHLETQRLRDAWDGWFHGTSENDMENNMGNILLIIVNDDDYYMVNDG